MVSEIYTNLPVDVILRLPHPQSRDSRIQEKFLAPTADKQTRNYDTECSNHYPTLSALKPKRLSRSKMKFWGIYTNLQMDVILRLPHPRSRDGHGQEILLPPSADKQTHNYDTQCSNHDPFLSTKKPKGLSRRKLKWWAIYRNLQVDVTVRLAHPRSRDSQGQETLWGPSPDKQTHNNDTEGSNHHPSLSTTRPKGLSSSEMKWWAIYKNLSVDVIVRVPYPRSEDSEGQETFSAPSPDKQTRNYQTKFSNKNPSLSAPRPKGMSCSKLKCWARYTNLPVDVTVRLPLPPNRDSWGQETFLGPSFDKQTQNFDTQCSNHHPSLLTLRPKGFSRSKIKWRAIYKNFPVDVIVRLSHPRSRDSQGGGMFLALSADKPTCNYDTEGSNHHPFLSITRPKGLSHKKMKWWAIYTNLPMEVIVRLPHPRGRDSQGQETFRESSAVKKTHNYDTECLNHHPSLSTLRPKGLSRSKMK